MTMHQQSNSQSSLPNGDLCEKEDTSEKQTSPEENLLPKLAKSGQNMMADKTKNLGASETHIVKENELSVNNPNQVKKVHIKCQSRQSSSEC